MPRASLALAGMILASCPCGLAINPALDVSQYAHATWRFRDGFTSGQIHNITQAPDGYLWLATGFGLYRFDGVRAVRWQPSDQRLPSDDVLHVVPARDGTLWIGTRHGLVSWKKGKLTQYPELADFQIFSVLEDRHGTVWVGAYGIPNGKLCEIRKDSVLCHPEVGSLNHGVLGLHEDAKGNLWVGIEEGLWRWKPGPPELYASGKTRDTLGMADEDGSILVSVPGGIARTNAGKLEKAYTLPAAMREIRMRKLLRDRDGGLWGTMPGKGLVHFHQGRTEVFTQADGLTSDTVSDIFEDREGNIWISTANGLDRFRELPIVTYTPSQGLLLPIALLGASDGSIWSSTRDGLDRVNHGQITVYRAPNQRVDREAPQVAVSGFPQPGIAALAEDSRGRIWLASNTGVGYVESNRFVPSTAPAALASSIVGDSAENMWIAYQELGLLRIAADKQQELIPWDTFGRSDPARTLAADPIHSGVWLGFFNGGLAYYHDGRVRQTYSVSDGLASGGVYSLRFDGEGALWAAAEGGLSRVKDGHVITLTSKSGLPCDAVHWTLEDNARSVWMMMPCGLVRIASSELSTWAASPDKAGTKIRPQVWSASDGARGAAAPGGQTPQAARALDGKLWFATNEGPAVVDPSHLPFNKLPPPITIEQVTADRKVYDAASNPNLRLPPRLRDLQIDYTALSLADPDKVLFRYKLEGRDDDWQDVGNRRQAYYNDLKPRHYRFRVMAANNSGVWNEAGASFDFSVDPAYYETTWFFGLMATASLALLAGLYQLRLRQVRQRFNIRMEERLHERTRIARDLHDTLLQSFQGVLLKFHAVSFMLPHRPEDARATLEGAIEQASRAITEGRDAVQGLRSAGLATKNLAEALGTVGKELVSTKEGESLPDFKVRVEGSAVILAPLVRDEIYRIAVEALRNAFRHALAKQIEVDIHYEKRQIRLQIRDDGKGIDQKVLDEGRREGHHGLPGMYERAKLIGGALAVWSELDSGTEIELSVPASIAYAESSIAQQTQ